MQEQRRKESLLGMLANATVVVSYVLWLELTD